VPAGELAHVSAIEKPVGQQISQLPLVPGGQLLDERPNPPAANRPRGTSSPAKTETDKKRTESIEDFILMVSNWIWSSKMRLSEKF
jgi:hypothetical protein